MNYLLRTTLRLRVAMPRSPSMLRCIPRLAASRAITSTRLSGSRRDSPSGMVAWECASDAAHLASLRVTHAHCLALRVGHRCDGHIPGSWIAEATARLRAAGIAMPHPRRHLTNNSAMRSFPLRFPSALASMSSRAAFRAPSAVSCWARPGILYGRG